MRPSLFEERRELLVVDLRDLRPGELLLERGRCLGPIAERRGRAREVRLRAAPLDLEQVEDGRRPRLVRQQLGERQARVERIDAARAASRSRTPARTSSSHACGEVVVAGRAQRRQPARELGRRAAARAPAARRRDRLVHERGHDLLWRCRARAPRGDRGRAAAAGAGSSTTPPPTVVSVRRTTRSPRAATTGSCEPQLRVVAVAHDARRHRLRADVHGHRGRDLRERRRVERRGGTRPGSGPARRARRRARGRGARPPAG